MKSVKKAKVNKDNIDVLSEVKKSKNFDQYMDAASVRIKLANEVSSVREALGITQPELAKIVNTTQAIISRIENYDVNIGIELLNRVAKKLEFKVNNWAKIFDFEIKTEFITNFILTEVKNMSSSNNKEMEYINEGSSSFYTLSSSIRK